jgi:spermidine dehydrogenase
MNRDISRRDFIHDVSLASVGFTLPITGFGAGDPGGPDRYYPPTKTGLRGSHPGSFEVAHALITEGRHFENARDTGEAYDLVVVGGGISGLSSAWFYRKLFGADSRILIIENHDEFGGHARRNEFHQGGEMRLAWGGVFNLEYTSFSDTVNDLIAELGIDIHRLLERYDFNYGGDGKLGPAVYFDAETYGHNALLSGFSLRYAGDLDLIDKLDAVPLDQASIDSLKKFYLMKTDVLRDMSDRERKTFLSEISYIDFIKEYGGLTDEAARLFVKTTDGYWGVGADNLSVSECYWAGLPIDHLLGGEIDSVEKGFNEGIAMFPDGNASVARLLVRGLIPGVADGNTMDDIVTADFDYSKLDRPGSPVRLRLNSTVVNVDEDDEGVHVRYVNNGETLEVKSRHCVLACWNGMIPYLCPQLPGKQKEAQAYLEKRPLVLTNVLLRSSEAADRLGISGAYCPGRLHASTWLVKGINVGDYQHEWSDDGSVVMMFWGLVPPSTPGLPPKEQHRESRRKMLAMGFEDYEREVRTVLNGLLGPGGFDVSKDVLAITVNRWPHGYAYDYLDLWEPDWPAGQAPHEIARKPFGNITIANADSGADAYTHVAIDQAWRAVNELSSEISA